MIVGFDVHEEIEMKYVLREGITKIKLTWDRCIMSFEGLR
jgi:hypothetical protein